MATRKLNVNIKQLDLITNWEFNSPTKECTLCKNLLVAPSLQELNGSNFKGSVIEGQIIVGQCKHMFHKDCLNLFMKSGCTSCPIDKTPWETNKIIMSGVVFGDTHQLTIKTKATVQ